MNAIVYNHRVSLALDAYVPAIDPARLPRAVVEGLYVHVPFCFHKCHYCDFYSITRQTPERMAGFVNRLLDEAELWSVYGLLRPRTVFFGGGTPSLLPLDQMQRLIRGLKSRFDLSAVEEWTIEVNPATADKDYCMMLRAEGVDRLSFGAQSFDRTELKTLERHHDPDDVHRSLELARQTGFERLNFDLIYAIPGQTLESWENSLEQAINLGTTHLSAYNLTFEPNTPMAVKLRLGQMRQAPEALELEMFRHVRKRLAARGLAAYEVSNYAAPGEECHHNLVYWTGGNYVGLGPSAASHVEGTRFRNRPHLGQWESAIGSRISNSGCQISNLKSQISNFKSEISNFRSQISNFRSEISDLRSEISNFKSHGSKHLPAIDVEKLSPLHRAGELAMLRLRLARGLNFDEFTARTGLDARELYPDLIDRLTTHGLLWRDAEGFGLTQRGFELTDAVAAEFLVLPAPDNPRDDRGEGF